MKEAVEYSVNKTAACPVTDVANILTLYFSSFFFTETLCKDKTLKPLQYTALRQYDRPENPIYSYHLLQDNLKV
jgi:hypothetical protein